MNSNLELSNLDDMRGEVDSSAKHNLIKTTIYTYFIIINYF